MASVGNPGIGVDSPLSQNEERQARAQAVIGLDHGPPEGGHYRWQDRLHASSVMSGLSRTSSVVSGFSRTIGVAMMKRIFGFTLVVAGFAVVSAQEAPVAPARAGGAPQEQFVLAPKAT